MFQEPFPNKFTVYSKSGCPNCLKVKDLLKSKNVEFEIVNCDNYLFDNRQEFLEFISEKAKISCKVFPIVFDGKKYVGGFNETKIHIEKVLDFGLDF
jgi:glutaredoxin